jgi:hypothetical protein
MMMATRHPTRTRCTKRLRWLEFFASHRNRIPAPALGRMAFTPTPWTPQPCQAWQSPPPQSRPLRSHGGDADAPLFWLLSAILAAGAGLFLLLHWLCQPTLNPNPGLAAYVAPVGTRLVPLPRKSDAPELAELPVDSVDPAGSPRVAPAVASPSALTALAKAEPSEPQGKRDLHPPARKRQRTDTGEHDQRGFGVVQQWNFGSPGSNSPHVMSGGPKSWF